MLSTLDLGIRHIVVHTRNRNAFVSTLVMNLNACSGMSCIVSNKSERRATIITRSACFLYTQLILHVTINVLQYAIFYLCFALQSYMGFHLAAATSIKIPSSSYHHRQQWW